MLSCTASRSLPTISKSPGHRPIGVSGPRVCDGASEHVSLLPLAATVATAAKPERNLSISKDVIE
jgi:hypothetical protein